jgi:hypothetical protein
VCWGIPFSGDDASYIETESDDFCSYGEREGECVMPKYIKKKALKNAIECCTWYHINKNGELVEGANPADHEPLYKYSDIKKIIKGLPTRKFKEGE